MPTGEVLSPADHRTIQRLLSTAGAEAECEFSVHVEEVEGDARAHAERLHAAMPAPEASVLVLVDPVGRRLEIVTGAEIRRRLDDSEAALAALAMQTSFAAGDYVGGITQGVQQLAEHARRPQTLHFDPR